MLEKIITLLVLFVVLAIVVASCSVTSQETVRYGLDRTADVLDRQPSAAELLLESRQTPPVERGGSTVWLGAGIAALVVLLLLAGLAYFIFGERWLKERRRYLRAMKRGQKAPAPTIQPVPYADEATLRPLPPLRRVSQLPYPTEEQDYGY